MKKYFLTVRSPKFLTRQFNVAVLPTSAVTLRDAETSKYGPRSRGSSSRSSWLSSSFVHPAGPCTVQRFCFFFRLFISLHFFPIFYLSLGFHVFIYSIRRMKKKRDLRCVLDYYPFKYLSHADERERINEDENDSAIHSLLFALSFLSLFPSFRHSVRICNRTNPHNHDHYSFSVTLSSPEPFRFAFRYVYTHPSERRIPNHNAMSNNNAIAYLIWANTSGWRKIKCVNAWTNNPDDTIIKWFIRTHPEITSTQKIIYGEFANSISSSSKLAILSIIANSPVFTLYQILQFSDNFMNHTGFLNDWLEILGRFDGS